MQSFKSPNASLTFFTSYLYSMLWLQFLRWHHESFQWHCKYKAAPLDSILTYKELIHVFPATKDIILGVMKTEAWNYETQMKHPVISCFIICWYCCTEVKVKQNIFRETDSIKHNLPHMQVYKFLEPIKSIYTECSIQTETRCLQPWSGS
jgi:hypothetical protein